MVLLSRRCPSALIVRTENDIISWRFDSSDGSERSPKLEDLQSFKKLKIFCKLGPIISPYSTTSNIRLMITQLICCHETSLALSDRKQRVHALSRIIMRI